MNHYNSTIRRKMCKCCDSCDKLPTIGWAGYNFSHAPQELKDKQTKRVVQVRSRANLANLSRKVKSYAKELGAEKTSENDLRSGLLKSADSLFSKFIRNRDSDRNGNISCICCGKIYNIEEKDSSGDKIVQCLHFIARTVYTFRYSEVNCHAGCGYCNQDMHLNPKGTAYKQFRDYLVACLGEKEVQYMEEQRRLINKLSESDIRDVIVKYTPTVNTKK